MKVERSPRRLLNALVPRLRDGLPPDTCGFGDWFGVVFGEANPPSARLELVAFSAW